MAGSKIATVERREARVPGNNGTRHLQKVPDCCQRRSGAPLPHAGEGRKKTADPTPTKNGDDESRLLECARIGERSDAVLRTAMHAGCLTSESEMKRGLAQRLKPLFA